MKKREVVKAKKTGLVFASVAVAALGTLGVAKMNTSVAANAEGTSVTFQMENGASVRLSDEGIRFRAEMNQEKYQQITENEKIKLYFVVAPAQFIDGKTDGKYAELEQKITIPVDESKIYEEDGVYYANGVVTQVLEQNRLLAYKSVAYIADERGEAVQYTYTEGTSAARSLYETLNMAIVDVKYDYASRILSAYEWFGASAENPVVIADKTEYFAILRSVNNGVSFENRYFKLSSDILVDSDADLLGENFKGTWTEDSKTAKVDKREEAKVNEIESFDHRFAIGTSIKTTESESGGVTLEWLESFNGASGVLKVNVPAKSGMKNLPFVPRLDKSEYAKFTGGKVILRAYIPSTTNGNLTSLNFGTGGYSNDKSYAWTNYGYNKWNNYSLSLEKFLADNGSYYLQLDVKVGISKAIEFYIDAVYVIADPEVKVSVSGGEEQAIAKGGAITVDKGASVKFSVNTLVGGEYELSAKANDGTTAVITDNTLMADKNYKVSVAYGADWLNPPEAATYNVAVNRTDAVEANEIENFGDELAIGSSLTWTDADITATYVEDGGKVKLVFDNSNNSAVKTYKLHINPRQAKSAYDSYTNVVVKAYIYAKDLVSGGYNSPFSGALSVGKDTGSVWINYVAAINSMREYSFTIAKVGDGWTDNGFDITLAVTANETGTILIDGIYCS